MEAFALSPAGPRLALPTRLLSDDRLLRLVAAGNPQAFGAVYARYHAPLYAYCRSIVRDPDDARDALQNTMLKALSALGRGEDRELSLKPWLFRIAHNESISLLRRRRPSEPLTDAVSPPVPGADREVVARERLGQLVADLRALPERQRSALIMREVNGLSYEDIAATLAISEGAARQTVFEARTALVEYGEGRDVACAHIRRSISDGDGRALRARRMRAHLRSCDACRDFHATLKLRRRDLAALAPGLSGGAALGLLQAVLGSGAVASGGVVSGGAGLLGGSTSALLATGAAKGVVAMVVVTAAGAGAAQVAAPAHHLAQAASPRAAAGRVVPARAGRSAGLRRVAAVQQTSAAGRGPVSARSAGPPYGVPRPSATVRHRQWPTGHAADRPRDPPAQRGGAGGVSTAQGSGRSSPPGASQGGDGQAGADRPREGDAAAAPQASTDNRPATARDDAGVWRPVQRASAPATAQAPSGDSPATGTAPPSGAAAPASASGPAPALDASGF